MRYWIISLALLTGCGTSATDGDTEDTDTDPISAFDALVNVTDPVGGDLACYTAGTDWETMAWAEPVIDTAAQVTQPTTAEILDFESDEPVADATLEIWLNDKASGTPDAIATTNDEGIADLAGLPTCEPFAYRVSTDPLLDETKVTLAAHKIITPDSSGTVSDDFTSVSKLTYQLIPTILGIIPLPENAIIAGIAYDCNEEPIEGAQIVVYDENGEIPESLQVEYFKEEFPNRDQPHTSPDGIWVAINVPPGLLRVEMWGNVDGELALLGATELDSFADTINLSNIYAGIGNGERYPEACLSAE
jgi:hypothetical protein